MWWLTFSFQVVLLISHNLSPYYSLNKFEIILLLILSSLLYMINSYFLIAICLIFMFYLRRSWVLITVQRTKFFNYIIEWSKKFLITYSIMLPCLETQGARLLLWSFKSRNSGDKLYNSFSHSREDLRKNWPLYCYNRWHLTINSFFF